MAKAKFRTKYNNIFHPTNNQKFTTSFAGVEADENDPWVDYQVKAGVLVKVAEPVEKKKPVTKKGSQKVI